jgi:Domain of Unknown Function (DUF349)
VSGGAGEWGRVDEHGNVFVRTKEGERAVGQWPDGDPAEALAFFARRYDSLRAEVQLLEQRLRSGHVSPDEASEAANKARAQLLDPRVVGDLDALMARLDGLAEVIAEGRRKRKAERAEKLAAAREQKETIAAAAEKLSSSSDWRGGVTRLRELLDQWKALPRLDKSTDEMLWRRFSAARTTYTRRRKQHFAELNEKRDVATRVKEKLVAEAETLAGSTEWGATSARYRDLMQQWKAAGPAHKEVEDGLWARFRGAQDTFFTARDAVNAEQDREFEANAEKKSALLVEAEKLLPVTDPRAAREALRGISERWDAIGKVPRERARNLEGRMRKVEETVRLADQERWQRSNPEAAARARATVEQLQTLIADLERQRSSAAANGDQRRVKEAEAALAARQQWLQQAVLALEEFSPTDP